MKSLNGVDTVALADARRRVADDAGTGGATWRATSEWIEGAHTAATVDRFDALGGRQGRTQAFRYDTDHPSVFGGADAAASPMEVVLVGLAGCLTAGVATIAESRGIRLRSVVATVEGDMDVRGILAIDPATRNGCSQVRVSYAIDADASSAEIRSLVAQSRRRSSVYDLMSNETSVVIEVTS